VQGLDLDIAAGERVLLLGASGSGKSTVLRALAGVSAEDEGEQVGALTIDGVPAASAPRGRAGLMLQDPESQVVLARVGDDVAFGPENLGVSREEIWRRVPAALEAVGLRLPLEHPTSRLSGGQKQRLALAGLLAMRPGLLLLDEPTAELDPAGVREVRAAVERALERTGATLVVVEHRVAIWRDLVDRVIVLGNDGVVADGDPASVLTREGAGLAARGIWVPEHPPAHPVRARATEAAPLLTAESLAVGYGRDVVRDDLEVTVRAGRLTALVGPNGAGKSTLANTLAGLRAPLGGTLTAAPALAGEAGPAPHRWRSKQLLTRIGMVFQNPEHQFVARTVRDELEVGPRALRLGETQTRDRVDALLAALRLDRLARAHPFTLSGGEQRRLSVATALAARPAVVVLDEPTFGQDSVTWAELVRLLAELLDDGVAVVAATHDAEFVSALADDVLELT